MGEKMTKYWIIPLTEHNWEVVKKLNIIGVAPRSPARNLISKDDVIIFYVVRKGATKYGGKFVGAYRVVSDWYYEEKPLWPDEVNEGKVKYPWRAKIEPIKLGMVDLRDIVEKLSFIAKKNRPAVYLMGTPANFKRPIPAEDAKIILEALR